MTAPLKLLLLLPFAPDLRGTHGGTRATAAIIEMLSERHRVSVLYLSARGAPPPREPPGNCESMVAIPVERRRHSGLARYVAAARQLLWGRPDWVEESWSPTVADRVAAVAAEFMPDIAQCEFHVMAQYIPSVRAACPEAACVVTEHEPGITADLGHEKSLTLKQSFGALARRRAWSRYERQVLRMADAVIVFTDSDAAAVGQLLGSSRPPISVIPLRLPELTSSPKIRSAPVRSDLVFVGNFRHPPNADAARRLVQSILPLILCKLPDATLAIVGSDPPQDLVDAASDRITVTGWVDDPSVYLAGASVVLVPLRQGGGVRVKMIEACAAGKAIVASPVALEGLSLKEGGDVFIAQTDEEFAAGAITLLADVEGRARLERASRRWWEKEHDLGRWAAQYDRLYAALGKAG